MTGLHTPSVQRDSSFFFDRPNLSFWGVVGPDVTRNKMRAAQSFELRSSHVRSLICAYAPCDARAMERTRRWVDETRQHPPTLFSSNFTPPLRAAAPAVGRGAWDGGQVHFVGRRVENEDALGVARDAVHAARDYGRQRRQTRGAWREGGVGMSEVAGTLDVGWGGVETERRRPLKGGAPARHACGSLGCAGASVETLGRGRGRGRYQGPSRRRTTWSL